MNLISLWDLRVSSISVPPATSSSFCKPSSSACKFHFPFPNYASRRTPSKSNAIFAKRGRSESAELRLKPNIIEQVPVDEEEQEEEQALFDEFDDEIAVDDASYFEDEFIENETDLYVGDGGGGGGIKLGGTWWDKEALAIAEDVCQSFDGQLKIYAFKTLSNSTIQVRIERLTNKSGSPSLEDIQAFSLAYRTRLDEAEFAKTIPDNISLEKILELVTNSKVAEPRLTRNHSIFEHVVKYFCLLHMLIELMGVSSWNKDMVTSPPEI
ncbi:uncharacterized protein LOC110815262 isoform X4 [Carica papaya]|uniref:uncharacterized protein LOC110815262 isoform X4 n=1 Tax=Carica papaya TaxID=3649 RepID=UPI000B8CDEFB|nr:uncharacterized protein LOC110815262 isoform X4 [Carica papaya]